MNVLAFIQTDPDQTKQAFAALAGMMGIFAVVGFAVFAFGIFLFWRILTKAGLSGPLSLLVLIPGVGWIIVLCILAFSDWPVAPVASAPYYPPSYPPPPPTYPAAPPPTQL
jgi:uncharacterized membrane protein YhaH (DUF805 family)